MRLLRPTIMFFTAGEWGVGDGSRDGPASGAPVTVRQAEAGNKVQPGDRD